MTELAHLALETIMIALGVLLVLAVVVALADMIHNVRRKPK